MLIVFFAFLMLGLGMVTGYLMYSEVLDSTEWRRMRSFGMTAVTLTLNFLAPFGMGICGVLLVRQGEREVRMNTEIVTVTIFWTLASGGFHALLLYYFFLLRKTEQIRMELSVVVLASSLLLLRNLVCFAVSIVHPVVKSNVENIIPYGETRGCVENLDIALTTELPYVYFAEFVEKEYSAKGRNIITLYTKIKIYEDSAKGSAREQEKAQELAKEIMQTYVRNEINFRDSGLSEDVRDDLETKFGNIKDEASEHLFDSVYEYVITQLEAYFKHFKHSIAYQNLYRELIRNEIIYERLVEADLI